MSRLNFPLFDFIRRKMHSGGFGIHSPFAFDLITNIIRDDSQFYAFRDIKNRIMESAMEQHLPVPTQFNRLVFRMMCRFRPENILEINSGKGVNTLFILAPRKNIRCTCVETDETNISTAQKLIGAQFAGRVAFAGGEELRSRKKYDAICLHLNETSDISIDQLLAKSHEQTFWIIDGIKNKKTKQFWGNIVNDERTRFTFDMKHQGIAFLKSSHYKLNFRI